MKLKVAVPSNTIAGMMVPEAVELLEKEGFDVVMNRTGRRLDREETKEMLKDAFAVIAGTEKYDEELLRSCECLRLIQRFGVGYDNLDLKTIDELGIKVGITSNYNAVAEYALALILAMLRQLPAHDRIARSGRWNRLSQHELSDKTVAVLGFGRIGKRVAKLLSAFGCTILVCDKYLDKEEAERLGAVPCSFEEAVSGADIISLHMPGSPENVHIIDRTAISHMKDGAYIVNTGRGNLIDEEALYEALRDGKLAGAALDVFEREPLSADSPLLTLDNLIVSPHAAALTHEANHNGFMISARSVVRVRDGLDPEIPLLAR